MLNGAEIETSLSGLEAFFKGEDKHLDSALAIADAHALAAEFRQAAEGYHRPDKGPVEIYRVPKAHEAMVLVERIYGAIKVTDPAEGSEACAALRKLASEQRWI
jgi:hypothetical protein